ncbi:hypothetical protein SMICM17S_03795 [Streptomyces microflavus]
MVRATLKGAVRFTHPGPLDISAPRRGRRPGSPDALRGAGRAPLHPARGAQWNRKKGVHKARTKHGNYNAWIALHGDAYDFFASVDTDHVPMPNFLERMMGYFRDPDVAFVVGPQVYGNYDSAVTKAAEPQQFLFHALIQRAGNRYRRPDVRRHQQRRPRRRRTPGRRSLRLDHPWRPASRSTAAANPSPDASGAPSTPPTCWPSAGARLLDGLLHPAAALVSRGTYRRCSSSTARHCSGCRRPAPQLHPDARLLPDDGRQLAARRGELCSSSGSARPAPRSPPPSG